MRRSPATVWLVESVSVGRLVAGLVFSSIAFYDVSVPIVASIYVVAMVSDLVDGFLARRLHAETYLGTVIDLVSDKSLTVISLLYAAARGIAILPLALIATREFIMIGARIIVVDGKALLATNRRLGGAMAALLWGTTLFLVIHRGDTGALTTATRLYWAAAIVFWLNLGARVGVSARRIRALLAEGE